MEVERINDTQHYEPPSEIYQHLGLKDVQLGYFQFVQHRIKGLKSGDKLKLSSEGCSNLNGDLILKFSAGYQRNLDLLSKKGFISKQAKIDFIVYWKGEGSDKEVMAVLPEIHFKKVTHY